MPKCPYCGNEATYIPKYNRYYCYHCQRYVEPVMDQPQQMVQKKPVCPYCGNEATYIPQYQRYYCYHCQKYVEPVFKEIKTPTSSYTPHSIWFQNFYRVRKKVLTVGNKYWIEDANGNILGFSKQKLFKLKEDIRIYTDESMREELFRIHQTQIVDVWGKFAVIDSRSNTILGYVRRNFFKSTFAPDEWEIYDERENLIGHIKEETSTGIIRKYVPGGALVPEKMTMYLNNVPVAEIEQQFKIIGDIWDLRCLNIPAYLDRRVMLAGLLLMAMIERRHK